MAGLLQLMPAVVVLFLGGCEESLHLRIVAPATLRGASVTVDGSRQGVLGATGDGASLTVELTPFHESVIVIEQPKKAPIIRRVLFRGYGTRTMKIASAPTSR